MLEGKHHDSVFCNQCGEALKFFDFIGIDECGDIDILPNVAQCFLFDFVQEEVDGKESGDKQGDQDCKQERQGDFIADACHGDGRLGDG
jgi:hypothetical protein